MIKRIKWYTRKYPLTTTEYNKGGRQEQKVSATYGKQTKQNGRCKSNYTHNNYKCKWIRQYNQKAVIVGLDKENKIQLYTDHRRHTLDSEL